MEPTEKQIELVPCPFCGGNAHIEIHDYSYVSIKGEQFIVKCDKACQREYGFKSQAIEAWNTRAQGG